jgi:F-type H+-transporting ATPase subunit delta
VLSSRAAKPYARALFEIAKERGLTAEIGAELDRVAAAVREAAPLREVLARPWIAAPAKRAMTAELATRIGLSTVVRDFIALVAAQGRIGELEAIAVTYRDLVDTDLGRVRARVRTAVPLSDPERATLAARLARELGVREAMLDENVDPTMLGGFVAEVGSVVFDGSLNGQLARLKERLAGA